MPASVIIQVARLVLGQIQAADRDVKKSLVRSFLSVASISRHLDFVQHRRLENLHDLVALNFCDKRLPL